MTVTVAAGSATSARDLVLEVRANANLLITPRLLSTARFGEAYSEQLEATGGVPPYTWVRDAGGLPVGLELTPSGEIRGTPQQVGTFRLVVQARDSGMGRPGRDINTFELTVVDPGGFRIRTATIAAAIVDEGYDATIDAEGGQGPYEWSLLEGRLPPGLLSSVNPATGGLRIAGQPTEVGVTNLLVRVRDRQGREALRAFALVVEEAPPPPLVAPDDDGCACDDTSPAGNGHSLGWALLLGGLLVRRRR
jgi:MYXO-CTERM domain-containing protein